MKNILTKNIKHAEIYRHTACISFLLMTVLFLSCGEKTPETQESQNPVPVVSGPFYHFVPGPDGRLEKAEKVDFPSNRMPRDLLKALGDHLAQTYFGESPSGEKTRIRFEILSIPEIESGGRIYRIAVINMADPEKEALNYFFQGSYGAGEAYFMITATLLQPQTRPPFLDGMIFQYNGEEFPELDHIHFNGIIVPARVEAMVRSAIHRSSEIQQDALRE
jgi:hypothetical protein